ncbi:hypothetical protein C2S51_008680 [Perilla frutescens var. frutescens]|nr:hypothetical protein C2S51_008680 [Perilla frutescens var. frutescens]
MDKGKNEVTASPPPIEKNEATASTTPIDDLKSSPTPDELSYSTDWDPKTPVRQAVRYERPRNGDGDGLLNNIKISIPEFEGIHDPDLYLDWERKVDKIFACYDFPEIKKVQLTALEFRGLLRGRFILVHYERDLEKKLNKIKQGTRSIEEYHKLLETGLNRARKEESLNATIIRYIEGMNPDIACEVELRDFTSIDDMVHYASIVERQLREGRRRSHQTSAPTRPPWNKGQFGPPERCFDRSAPQPNRRLESTPTPPARPSFQWPNQPNVTPNSAHNRAHDIQCHKCQGWGYFQNQCPNRRVLFLNEQNGLESASEDEEEPKTDAPATINAPKVEQEDEEHELPPVSFVSIRSLNINCEDEEQSQRENIFYRQVAIQGQTCAMIIHNGSIINAISQYAVDKLTLTTTQHLKPYKL